MPAVSFEMMNHFTHMDKALKKYNVSGDLNFSDYTLKVKNAEKEYILHPQYQGRDGYYYPHIAENTARFIGWRPYAMKTWKKSADKIAFKQFLQKNSISTPAFYTQNNDADGINDVIIKLEESSFGKGIKGPFKSTKNIKLDVQKREFFEQYIEGDIVKIWFCDGSIQQLSDMCFIEGIQQKNSIFGFHNIKTAITDTATTKPYNHSRSYNRTHAKDSRHKWANTNHSSASSRNIQNR